MVATIYKLSFCAEKFLVLIEGKVTIFSSSRYLEPTTKSIYRIYTTAGYQPLYPNVVKLEDRGLQQYVETKKKFEKRKYQILLRNVLNANDEKLHRNLCFHRKI